MKKTIPNKLSPVAASFAAALIAAGCTLQPDYIRPDAPVPQAWPTGEAYSAEKATASPVLEAADIDWQTFFTDPTLRALIERALDNNRDLRVAALNVEAQRAQYRISRADLFPALDATGSDSVQRTPSSQRIPGEAEVSRQYSASVGVTAYEVDLFGRVRSLNQQALQTYLSLEETRRSTQISLVAEVANAYLTLLSDQTLLRITRDTLDTQSVSYALSQQLFDNGRATELDLRQAESALETARANLANYTRLVAQDRNALQLLVGAALPELPNDEAGLDIQRMLEDLPAGLPSDLIARRPDILSAEHELLASNANIGAARAAFFPRITLTGSAGTPSLELSGLFGAGSAAWSFAPQIQLPIFSGGANRANLDLAKVQKRIDIAQYEQAIQIAFREVSDALAARGTLQTQLTAQKAVVNANAKSLKLSELRFHGGRDTYLTVLDSQRTLFSAQQALIGNELARMQNLVSLYKALGGGWRAEEAVASVDSGAVPQP